MIEKSIKKRKEQGITLITLVITIVILVILASILINVSSSDVQLISTTKESVTLYEIEEYKEIISQGLQKTIIEEAVLRRRNIPRQNRERIR